MDGAIGEVAAIEVALRIKTKTVGTVADSLVERFNRSNQVRVILERRFKLNAFGTDLEAENTAN